MAKKLDLNKPVFELVQEYPELVDILKDLGFSEITKPVMLNSVGRITTIPKGAKMRNISMMKVVPALMSNGFELIGKMPNIFALGKNNAGDETSSEDGAFQENTREKIKSYLKRLGEGEDLESVRKDFVENFSEVEASEIMKAEQGLMREGTPLAEVQQLCDLHSALFHGSTIHEQMDAEHAKVEAVLEAQEKSKSVVTLVETVGHPLNQLTEENKALDALIESIRPKVADKTATIDDVNTVRQVSVHYAKKGDLLYPKLKVDYAIGGPSMVMWTVDGDIRDQLGDLAKSSQSVDDWYRRFDELLTRAQEMIYKEQNILFPICAENFSTEEWYQIYKDTAQYEEIFGVKRTAWTEAETALATQTTKASGDDNTIALIGGSLTVDQLNAMLNTMPMEVTFVDHEDINRYFNDGEKVFKRPTTAIGRDVYSCHPPKVEPIVRGIIDSFRKGDRDNVAVWLEKQGRPFYVNYMAVRDQNNNYIGTLELVQDMQFAKEHFGRIK